MRLPKKKNTNTNISPNRTRRSKKTTQTTPVKQAEPKMEMATIRLGTVPAEYYFIVNGTKYPGSSIVEFEANKPFSMTLSSDDPEYYAIIEKIKLEESNQIQFTIKYYKELKEAKDKKLSFGEYPEEVRNLIIKNIKLSDKFTFKDCSKSLQDYVLTH